MVKYVYGQHKTLILVKGEVSLTPAFMPGSATSLLSRALALKITDTVRDQT
jgi:hypothetical protein